MDGSGFLKSGSGPAKTPGAVRIRIRNTAGNYLYLGLTDTKLRQTQDSEDSVLFPHLVGCGLVWIGRAPLSRAAPSSGTPSTSSSLALASCTQRGQYTVH